MKGKYPPKTNHILPIYKSFETLFIFICTIGLWLLVTLMGSVVTWARADAGALSSFPDEHLVFAPTFYAFNTAEFLSGQNSSLTSYTEIVNGKAWTAAAIINYNAHFFSINPQILLTLLELQSGVVTSPVVAPDVLDYAMGNHNAEFRGLFRQVQWATEQLFTAFYAQRHQHSEGDLFFRDGNTILADPGMSPGTFAIYAVLAQTASNKETWQRQISPDPGGFFETYARLFGDPLHRLNLEVTAAAPTTTNGIAGARLPWTSGETWYFTGGPHHYTGGAYDCTLGSEGCPTYPWSAVDFATPESVSCSPGSTTFLSNRWAVAAKDGDVIFSGPALVKIDHGDGWVTFYSHVSSTDRVAVGPILQGAHVGHPSCEVEPQGSTTGVHLHFATAFNGVFQNISGTSLSGWIVQEAAHYMGTMRCLDGRIRPATLVRAGNDITDNCLPRDAVDVSLIIDSSGSMTSNDPHNQRLDAAKAYLTASKSGDYVAVVDFDSDVALKSGLRRIPDERQTIADSINTIDSSGNTNIRDAIEVACNELTVNGANAKRGAILLTDGHHNIGDFGNPQQCFKDSGWPIFTYGFGSADEALLQQIADETGGEFMRIDNINSLVCEFQRVRAKIAGVEPGPCTSHLVKLGETISLFVAVASGQAQATFSTSWSGSDVMMSLITPLGRVIDRNTVAPDVRHDLGSAYEIYSITDPESGDWVVNLYGADVPSQGEETIFGFSTIPAPTQFEPGDCNGDQTIGAADITALALEFFDGDDNSSPAEAPNGAYPGNPGCDANEDGRIGAGDLACVAVIFFNGPGLCQASQSATALDAPTLVIPDDVPATPGGQVTAPITFQGNGGEVGSLLFSIDYNETWLAFDPADHDQDGIPDAITFGLPAGFVRSVAFDSNDSDGELDVMIAGFASPAPAIQEGVVLTLTLRAGHPPEATAAAIAFSQSPPASFGDPQGRVMDGVTTDGVVLIAGPTDPALQDARIYLPLVLHHR